MTNESLRIIAILPIALIGFTLSVSVWLLTEKLKPGFLGKDVEIALEKMSISVGCISKWYTVLFLIWRKKEERK
ncbi:hypothetical protein [Macrococcus bovicus]|uniref:hypothetical protein n=1 Tax=Macrococcus bovicus TaxID=69968 RepID=UPI0025A5DCF0|nr:hypothetical protein [Macrococcus bovicus]WJP96714.1 hypothetical protein QSV55_00310 [Macrococcus bovicus]